MSGSNIYEAGAVEIFELFSDYLSGSASRAALVASAHGVSEAAGSAVEKSLAAFGYGADACTYATLYPANPEIEGGDVPLDPQAFFFLVEGIDPLMVICADEQTVEIASQAYRTTFEPDSATRAFGRPAVMFRDLDNLMNSEAGKQKAWKLLKSLPRR